MSDRIKHSIAVFVELLFILFIFYANILMGEYTHSNMVHNKGLWASINNILTLDNFIIALVAALISHFVFGYLRKKL